jgi:hypothetical protein
MPSTVFVMSISSYIFFGRMIDGAVHFELFTDPPIDPTFVGSEMGFPISAGNDQWPNSLRRHMARWAADRAVDKIRERFGWEVVGYGSRSRWAVTALFQTRSVRWPNSSCEVVLPTTPGARI